MAEADGSSAASEGSGSRGSESRDGTGPVPRLSFGVPVRNGAGSIGSTLESLLAQDFDDFEVIVCDNDSSDETAARVEEFARRDPRVRFVANGKDIGQIENFNRVYELARGEFFRWIGSGDVLAPEYAGRCIAALERAPEAVGCTTLWEFVEPDGSKQTSDYRGQRLQSGSRMLRMARFLSFQTRDRLHLDPIYSMMRREVLLDTRGLLISSVTDYLLALEMVLRGPFCHIDEILATRRLPTPVPDVDVLVRTYHPSLHGRKRVSFGSRHAEFREAVELQDLPPLENLAVRAILWLFRFWAPLHRGAGRQLGRAGRLLSRLFGLARSAGS